MLQPAADCFSNKLEYINLHYVTLCQYYVTFAALNCHHVAIGDSFISVAKLASYVAIVLYNHNL